MDSCKSHFNIVSLLINQYQLLKKICFIEISQLISLEKRILISLFVLTECIEKNESEPDSYIDTFIYLARRLLSNDSEMQEFACQSACQWLNEKGLIENDNKCAKAAYDIICLFPSQQMQYQLGLTYKNFVNLRACIFSIWIKQSNAIDDTIFQNAEVRQHDSALESEVVSYKTHFKLKSNSVLLESYASSDVKRIIEHDYAVFNENEKQCFKDILWQCLQLKFKSGFDVLESLLKEQKLDKGLLRMASLTGDNRYLPYIADYSVLDPDVGYYFLSLLGTYAAANIILQGLSNMRNIDSGSQAWFLLTGMKIPLKPRLSLANEEVRQCIPGNQSPDINEIEQWWLNNNNFLKKDKRWLNGKPHCLNEIIIALQKYAGRYGHDLVCLYKLETQDDSFCDIEDGWFTNKLSQYVKLYDYAESLSKPHARNI